MLFTLNKRKLDYNKPIFRKNLLTKEQNEENAKLRRKLIKQENLMKEFRKCHYQNLTRAY